MHNFSFFFSSGKNKKFLFQTLIVPYEIIDHSVCHEVLRSSSNYLLIKMELLLKLEIVPNGPKIHIFFDCQWKKGLALMLKVFSHSQFAE